MAMNERTVTVPLAHEVRGSGPVLVLVAGTGYPGATWRPSLVNLLAERTTVVTFDHRGTGTSAVGAAPFSTRLFAADLAALLDGLGIASAHVLGHSMGGRVIQWLALDRPDLVRSLILAATGPGQIDPGQPLVRGLPLITARELIEHGYHDYMKEHIADTFFTDEFIVESPEVVSDLVAAFWNNRPGLDAYLRPPGASDSRATRGVVCCVARARRGCRYVVPRHRFSPRAVAVSRRPPARCDARGLPGIQAWISLAGPRANSGCSAEVGGPGRAILRMMP